jgi:hypothetical protein
MHSSSDTGGQQAQTSTAQRSQTPASPIIDREPTHAPADSKHWGFLEEHHACG